MRAAWILLVAGCWTRDVAPIVSTAPTVTHPAPGLEVVLLGAPLQLTMATRKDFKIKFIVTNHGETVADPKIGESDLTINGVSSVQWAASVGNGAVDEDWTQLLPQHAVSREWMVGETLFTQPGDFTLVLHDAELESAPLHIHVAP